jgi:sigma-B regulation protein RsbU (phosphoserine phosphatase)
MDLPPAGIVVQPRDQVDSRGPWRVEAPFRVKEEERGLRGPLEVTQMPRPQRKDVRRAFPAGIRAYPAREISEHVSPRAGAAETLARQVQALEILRKAASQLVAHRSVSEVCEHLLELLFSAVAAERGAILVLEGNELVTRAWRTRGEEASPVVSRSIAERVLRERVALLIDNALDDPRFSAARSIVVRGVRSAICAPLWPLSCGDEDVVGLVYLDTSRFSHAFDEDDLGLVTAIAHVAAAKIQNVRLLEDSLERRRLEEEMRLAAELQAGLLPSDRPVVPGWDLAAWTNPCYAVGGDYFDFEAASGGLRLALGDVAGKGTAAALLMTVLRALVRTSWGSRDLAGGASWLNRALLDSVPSGRYATLFLARLEAESGGLSYLNAGHFPPLLVRQGGRITRLEAGGLPLGLLPQARFEAGYVRLEPGDALLVFSDGLPETQRPDGEEFGLERLTSLAAAARGRPAAELARRISDAVQDFAGDASPSDDRTLLVLTREPAGA